jgi:hypothetical protein
VWSYLPVPTRVNCSCGLAVANTGNDVHGTRRKCLCEPTLEGNFRDQNSEAEEKTVSCRIDF